MRKPGRLQLAQIAKQRSRGGDRSVIMLADAEPLEGEQLEVAGQLLARERWIELPCLALGHERSLGTDARGSRRQVASARGANHLARRQAGEQRSDVVRARRVEPELSGRQ